MKSVVYVAVAALAILDLASSASNRAWSHILLAAPYVVMALFELIEVVWRGNGLKIGSKVFRLSHRSLAEGEAEKLLKELDR